MPFLGRLDINSFVESGNEEGSVCLPNRREIKNQGSIKISMGLYLRPLCLYWNEFFLYSK